MIALITTTLASAVQTGRTVRRKRDVKAQQVTSRTKMGARGIRKRDLVLVHDPRDNGEEFTALVIGGYTLDQQWYLLLEPPPRLPRGSAQPVLRQSTKARHVREHWRRDTTRGR